MTIRAMKHVAISTGDLDRAVDFWAALGFVETRRWDWPAGVEVINTLVGLPDSAARAALLEGPGTGLEIFEFVVPAPGADTRSVHRPGYTHVCFEVDDLDDEIDRLAAAGMTFWAGPAEDRAGQRMVYGHDPDGNVVELVEPAPRPGVR